MNAWIHGMAVIVASLVTGCGGGGGGDSSSAGTGANDAAGGSTIGGNNDGGVAPKTVLSSQGFYGGIAVDPQRQSNSLFAQAFITSDGKALIYLEEDFPNGVITVIDGRLTASGSDATLTQATAFSTGMSPTAASGSLQLDTIPNDSVDLRAQVSMGGKQFNIEFQLQPGFTMPLSLQSLAGRYGLGFRPDFTVSDSEFMIDPAGNVIITQDSVTGCSGVGSIAVDVPAVNAYTLSLQLMGCMNSASNGTYTGRLAFVEEIFSFVAHSSTLPLYDFEFEKL